jgi:asparagine synthetase B (glutamine-hydrolysing)
MCGITGIYHFNKEQPIDKKALKAMADSTRHRGSDGEGFLLIKTWV